MAEKRPNQNWFFVRGLVREAAHWGEFLLTFQAEHPEGLIHCLDLPGCGVHHAEESPLTIEGMAASLDKEANVILEEQRRAGFEGVPNYLLSISLGSMVALAWIDSAPSLFQGVVLINTSLRGMSSLYDRLSPEALPLFLKVVTVRDDETRERGILHLTSQRTDWSDAFIKERIAVSKRHPVTRRNFARQLIAAGRFFLTANSDPLARFPQFYPVQFRY